MTAKEQMILMRISDIHSDCTYYLNSGKGTDVQKIVWKDRQEVMEKLYKLIDDIIENQ